MSCYTPGTHTDPPTSPSRQIRLHLLQLRGDSASNTRTVISFEHQATNTYDVDRLGRYLAHQSRVKMTLRHDCSAK